MCALIILLFVTAAFFFGWLLLGLWISTHLKSKGMVALVWTGFLIALVYPNWLGSNLMGSLMSVAGYLDHLFHHLT